MESIIYQSGMPFVLDAIIGKAQSTGYQTQYKHVTNSTSLGITVALLPYPKMWQWVEADEATLRILTEINLKRTAQHPSGSVYVINFTPSTVLELARFLKPLLLEYGGWIGMEDEMKVVYNAENIGTFADHPFADHPFFAYTPQPIFSSPISQ